MGQNRHNNFIMGFVGTDKGLITAVVDAVGREVIAADFT